MQIDEQTGTRVMVRRNGRKCYFTITEFGIMFSAPNESALENADEYSSVNSICRLASKLRAKGETWAGIVKQFDGANVTESKTWVREIAQVIRDVQGVA